MSPLHRDSPWKGAWNLVKDGDVWEHFQKAIRAKPPDAVILTKAKGHATNEMVREKKVEFLDKHGNDQADGAADQGSIEEQPVLYHMGNMYSKRHKAYVSFMEKVHAFLIKVKEADKAKRKEQDLQKDPFGKEKEKCTKIRKSLRCAEEGETTKKLRLSILRENKGASKKRCGGFHDKLECYFENPMDNRTKPAGRDYLAGAVHLVQVAPHREADQHV